MSLLVQDLHNANKIVNQKIANNVNNALINLRNAVNKKEIPEKEKPDVVINIAEKILEFNKQQKGSGLKVLTPKQTLQILPITLAQVKAGNTSENILNEILQIIHSLYRAKEITKKVYNSIMSSINL